MKLSLSWIKDFVNIPEDMDMKQLAYDLTMDTVEVEDVEYLADRFDHMVVGVITKLICIWISSHIQMQISFVSAK